MVAKSLKSKKAVTLDYILETEAGDSGWFQLRIIVFAFIISVFNAFCIYEFAFTTGTLPTRCKIPECDQNETIFTPTTWISNAIPETSDNLYESCSQYETNYTVNHNGPCSSDAFNHQNIIPCSHGYVYDGNESVVNEFDLGCQEWKRAAIGTYSLLGTVIGHILTGFISDHWGRKTSLLFNAINAFWLGSLRFWANSYTTYVILKVMESVLSTGSFSCIYLIVTEYAGTKYRIYAGNSLLAFFTIGQAILGIIVKETDYWRYVILALYLPQVISISYIWMVPESARWLLSKGRFEKAKQTLIKLANSNNRSISDESFQALKDTVEENAAKHYKVSVDNNSSSWLPVLLLKYKAVLLRSFIAPFWWFTNLFTLFYLNINSVNIGDKYTTFIVIQLVALPGPILSAFLTSKFGRKKILLISFCLCAVFQIAFIFIPSSFNWLSLLMYLTSVLSIAVLQPAAIIYTVELNPTQYRQTFFAMSFLAGKLGTVFATISVAFSKTIWYYFPNILVISLCLISAGLTFLTPETHGIKLPDTLEEANEL